jgi:hypothetical protein
LSAPDALDATCSKPATTHATAASPWLRTAAFASLARDTSLESWQVTIPRGFLEAEENRTNVRRLRGAQQSVMSLPTLSLMSASTASEASMLRNEMCSGICMLAYRHPKSSVSAIWSAVQLSYPAE